MWSREIELLEGLGGGGGGADLYWHQIKTYTHIHYEHEIQ